MSPVDLVAKVFPQQIDRYAKQHSEIEIKRDYLSWDRMNDKIMTSVVVGDLPDGYREAYWNESIYNGKDVGELHHTDIRMLYCNSGHFEEIGLKSDRPSTTWEESYWSIQKSL